MPAPVRRRGGILADREPVATDTAFLTVMLDVTANLLCTAIILLVLTLAIDRRDTASAPVAAAVSMAPILAPAALVSAFHARAATVADTITIDIDRTGVTVKPAGSSPASARRLDRRDVTAGKLAALLAGGERAGVLLFIFDQEAYGATSGAVRAAGLSAREVDVPLALRSEADPQTWSRGFRSLFGLDLDAPSFQQRLQQILVGQGDGDETRIDGGPSPGAALARLRGLLDGVGFWWRLTLVGTALGFMIRLRRRVTNVTPQRAPLWKDRQQ
jgi:hypothetical protein